jgi:hypothetical protein
VPLAVALFTAWNAFGVADTTPVSRRIQPRALRVEHAIYLHATDPDLLCSNAVPGAPQARD